jgi:predicted DNA-binding protein
MNKTARSGTESATRKPRSRKLAWSAPERPISVRFEPEMIKRLDRVASQLSQVNANIRIGRSSVVKLAMERALSDMEAELSILSS